MDVYLNLLLYFFRICIDCGRENFFKKFLIKYDVELKLDIILNIVW